ncbi:MAG: LPS export ABC transporter periplasmic protein LptC [Prevotellaceae bacterium]|nr:LPS export ABC transporter periplasmic protein LptC [Prevotellaceae bacterium]
MIKGLTKCFSITVVLVTAVMLFFLQACQSDEVSDAPQIGIRDSLPVLKTVGVSTLISDSGVIRYKMIAEEWFVYDKKTPTYWSFEKGLFIEKFDEAYHVEAFISCDTAYYYDQKRLWELRGRVFVKNQKGETFKTSLLFWDQAAHRIYSDQYMEIDGEEQDLSGYNFSSNEQMTDYIIHSSKGAFPLEEKEIAPPVEEILEEDVDTIKDNTH